MGEQIVDNDRLGRREAWNGDRLVAWIDKSKLTESDYIGWSSQWMMDRWLPKIEFGE